MNRPRERNLGCRSSSAFNGIGAAPTSDVILSRSFTMLALAAIACGPTVDEGPADVSPSGVAITGPDGVLNWEHTVLPLDERGADRIQLVEDRVIGDQPGEADSGLYGARDLAIDSAGKIYVLESLGQQIRVFDTELAQVYILGRGGQGPGEMAFPTHITTAGDHVVVNDSRLGKLLTWDTAGAHLEDRAHGRRFDPGLMHGLPDGSLLALYGGRAADPEAQIEIGDPGAWRNTVARFSLGGEELESWAVFPKFGITLMKPGPEVELTTAAAYNEGAIDSSNGRPLLAVDAVGRAYMIETSEYRVRATDAGGETRWVLHAAFVRQPYPVEELDRRAARLSQRRAERCGCAVNIDRSYYAWDEHLPALEELRVDGHGHLWVFPTPRSTAEPADGSPAPAPATRPVDVYSADGELLYSGDVTNVQWTVAFGEYVHAIERDDETDEQVLVRYRVDEPF